MDPQMTKWEVTKWEDDTMPLEVYTLVDRGRRGWSCNSPGCRPGKVCKHVKVINWRRSLPIDEVPEKMFRF
jgi:hypothetical protein